MSRGNDGLGDWLMFLLGMKYAGKVAQEMGAPEAGREMEEVADQTLSCLGQILLVILAPVILWLALALVCLVIAGVVGLLSEAWQFTVACLHSPVFWVITLVIGFIWWLARCGRR